MNLLLLCALITFVQAHSGGLKKSGPLAGCHNDRKHGGFHCHSKSSFDGRSWPSEATALREMRVGGSKLVSEHSKSLRSSRYSRQSWKHWTDDDGDCQDTRVEILIRDSTVVPRFKDGRKCKVREGQWIDFYTAETGNLASQFEIDHVVPLKHAHDNGGIDWTPQKKKEFANDPLNLVVALVRTNRSKGANDFVNWHPANKKRTCEYAKRWFLVKKKYGLRVSEIETENIKILQCPDVTVTEPPAES